VEEQIFRFPSDTKLLKMLSRNQKLTNQYARAFKHA
jgi:hypothetical protein